MQMEKDAAKAEEQFLRDMIKHHEMALKMSKDVLKVATAPKVIDLANSIIQSQSKEIDLMKKWLSLWY